MTTKFDELVAKLKEIFQIDKLELEKSGELGVCRTSTC